MPAKNSVKQFVENSYYHIYNRGVEKRNIFMEDMDYAVFLSYLKTYLLPKDEQTLQKALADENGNYAQKAEAIKLLRMNNFSDNVELLAYCLMTNHFHFLVKQTESTSIDSFMNSLSTRYSMYFNRKYKRVGHLFQGTYKAVLVESKEQLLHLTRYIHSNPGSKGVPFQTYDYSSYRDYLNPERSEWVKPKNVLTYFATKGVNSYQEFMGDHNIYDSVVIIKDLIIDSD